MWESKLAPLQHIEGPLKSENACIFTGLPEFFWLYKAFLVTGNNRFHSSAWKKKYQACDIKPIPDICPHA